MNPKISIVTAVFNAQKTFQAYIDSIREQKDAIEVLVIDGGSRDQTVDLIRQNADCIDYWISEKDKGIYDAWNKGVKAATGDWIMFLGADDALLPGTIARYLEILPGLDARTLYVSSKVQMIDTEGNNIRVKGWPWKWPSFLKMMTVAHPGSLHSRELFQQYGLYDISYRITGDYELLLRPKEKLNAVFLDFIAAKMTEGGASDSIAALKEHYRAAVTTGGAAKAPAKLDMYYKCLKFIVKKSLRKVGINAYLKRA